MSTERAAGTQPLAGKMRQVLVHLDRGELPQAETLLSALVEQTGPQAELLQLTGVLRRLQGRDDDAEHCYRQALALDPRLAHVHNNLGSLMLAKARPVEAIEAFTQAVRLRPNYEEAHLNLAITYSSLGDTVQAEAACRQALRIQPNYLAARQMLAAILNQADRPREAESQARQALAAGPRDPLLAAKLEHSLGIALKRQRKWTGALAAFESARAKAPGLVAIEKSRAHTLQQMGQLPEAVESFRRALAADPLDIETHDDLNKLLYRMGDEADFLKSYDDAAFLYPELGIFPLKKANLQFLKGDIEAAHESFRQAASLMPDHHAPRLGIALTLARSGELAAAIREHETVAAMAPGDAQGWRDFAETLLRAREPGRARIAAERAMTIEPENQLALAVWTLALRILGEQREATINDYEAFVRVYELPPPDGYSDMETFNRDLSMCLDALHNGSRELIDQTLRAGTQTVGNLFEDGHRPVDLLRARIDEAVTDFVARMPSDEHHPLLTRKSPRFAYSGSWSARLHDCGFHTNHVHPKGWISSAYYVALPESVAQPGSREGWIQFGEPNFDCGLSDAVKRAVQPRPGTLVLFPSYMWHGTVPFHSARSRTTIAFDVIPLA